MIPVKGKRVRLKTDFMARYNIPFKAGQTGKVFYPGCKEVVVEFDGYEEERRHYQEIVADGGEGPNVVGYLAFIPVDLLEEL